MFNDFVYYSQEMLVYFEQINKILGQNISQFLLVISVTLDYYIPSWSTYYLPQVIIHTLPIVSLIRARDTIINQWAGSGLVPFQ